MFSLFLAMSLGAEPTPQFTVENKVPAFVVENKVAVTTDPRGVWSPVWDGRVWQSRWIGGKAVSQPATPFPITPGTIVQSAGEVSTSFPGAAPYPVHTLIPARPGTVGGTNCPPSG